MRRRIIRVAVILSSMISLTGCAKKESSVEAATEPEPLVIETQTKQTNPSGVYYGTVTINGDGIEDSCYDGYLIITMDGDRVRVTCTEAVRSIFGDVF